MGAKVSRISSGDHRVMVLWACDCAERVAGFFEVALAGDDRVREAIEAGRAWVRGEISMQAARVAAFGAHAAAREMREGAGRAAARAAGHAAATAHVASHARHAAGYAAKAVRAAGGDEKGEREWQRLQLPEGVRGKI